MSKFAIMSEGGSRIARIKLAVEEFVKVGITPLQIDALVERLILEGGDKPSFKMVAGYHHATCINVNSGMVHGIPDSTPVKAGDLLKIDLGLFHQGFHVDTAITIALPPVDPKIDHFVKTCQLALDRGIVAANYGDSVFDISTAIENTLVPAGYSPIRDLTGHGVGRELHMEPYIPCYAEPKNKKDVLSVGQSIAVEIMASMGDYHLVEAPDGWTLSTQDGSLTCMIEETVVITEKGPVAVTKHK